MRDFGHVTSYVDCIALNFIFSQKKILEILTHCYFLKTKAEYYQKLKCKAEIQIKQTNF